MISNQEIINYMLNKRALEFRNSKQYFIGDRVVCYLKLIKKFKIIKFVRLLFEDVWRVLYKKKRPPLIEEIDFFTHYDGEKIAVYTSIYGNYDILKEPLYRDKKCDYYVFTDMEVNDKSIWKKVEYIFPFYIGESAVLKNRYVKMHPHIFFKEYRYSIYIDGNLQILSEISQMVKKFNSEIGIALHKHPSNKSVYEEIKYNIKLGNITNKEGKRISSRFKEEGMPEKYGMFECNVILRENSNSICIKLMEDWWKEFFDGIRRDQFYFTYVLWRNGYIFEDITILGENINANPMFIRYEHNKRGI